MPKPTDYECPGDCQACKHYDECERYEKEVSLENLSMPDLREVIEKVKAARKEGSSLPAACSMSGVSVVDYQDARQLVRDLEAETL